MCGRYDLGGGQESDEELEEIIALLNRRPENAAMKQSGEVFPADIVPVIANSRRMRVRPFAMQWGYRLAGGKRVINARSETAWQKPLFQDGIQNRRCLIPAVWYYEWERHDAQKIRHAIRPHGSGLLYMAGIYRSDEAQGRATFAILTREAAPEIAFIHPRMPVMLPREAAQDWLNPRYKAEELLASALGGVPLS